MIELSTLGATELRRDGIDVQSVLNQPKRLALLVYLRVAAPGGFVTRDRLLALFWPESDDERARNALRQSLHFLRRSLGDDVVVSRAEQEVGINAGAVVCDAVAFEESLARDRLDDALALYRGELLPGFHVEDAPELERWIEATRSALSRRAVEAAETLAERAERRGEVAAAAVWARRLVALDPLGEAAARRLMSLLARSGERARALEAFDELERRLRDELELTPSPETAALADRIRSGAALPVEVAASTPDPASAEHTAAPSTMTATTPLPRPADGGALSGEAISSRSPGGPAEQRRRRSSFVLPLLLTVVLLAAAGTVLAPRLRQAGSPDSAPAPAPAIAVMPFLDLTDGGAREFLSDGVSEELLNVLARVPGLRVAARTSSFAFRGSHATADSIGRALGVTHLLEGSIRTDGDRVRVTVQLIEAHGGFHVWSETYDRSLDDIFALQDEISAEVVERLRLTLTRDSAPSPGGTPDAVAHEFFLRGRHAWNRRTLGSVRSAIDYFERAVARDPSYAMAWAGLAEALVVFPQYAGVPQDEWHERAEAAALRAIALDPSMAEPHAVLGLRMTYTRSSAAERHYRTALRLNPNYATAHHWYSIYFGERGRYEDQLREILLARSLDPLSPIIQVNVGKAYLHLRRFDEAVAAYEQLVATEPGFGFGHAVLAEALSAAGRHAEAAAAARRALDLLGEEAHVEALAETGYALARAGDREAARRLLPVLEERALTRGLRPGAWGPAQVYAALGETGMALDWVERAVVEDHWGGRPDLPWFDPLRDDPRFQQLARRFDRS